jgi:hypothetical protein
MRTISDPTDFEIEDRESINPLKPTGHVMHQQFNRDEKCLQRGTDWFFK